MYIGLEEYHLAYFGNFTWQYGDADDELAREAFRSLLLIGSDDSIQAVPSKDIMVEWAETSLRMMNYTFVPNDVVSFS